VTVPLRGLSPVRIGPNGPLRPSGTFATLSPVHAFLVVLLLGGSLTALVSMPAALLAHARKRS
jgi:hypothetical protein